MSRKREKILRIAKIDMIKEFFSSSHDTDDSEWFVIGHYDYLKVTILASGRSFLDSILEDAKKSSISSVGQAKHHVLYALDHMVREDDFWDSGVDEDKNYLVVSLIHLSPTVTNNKTHIQRAAELEELLSIEKTQTGEEVPPSYRVRVYVSIDCSDLVVFWKTNSLEKVTNRIGSLSQGSTYQECFSIQACKYSLISRIGPDQKVKNGDAASRRINLYLRGRCFSDTLSVAKELLSVCDNAPNIYITAGQDDIVIPIRVDQIEELFPLYAKLVGLAKPTYVLCRTEIEEQFGGSVEQNPEAVNPRSETSEDILSCRIEVKNKLCNEFSRLLVDYNNLRNQNWFAPLCELFNEFSEIAESNIADDIYYQSVNSLFLLIELLRTYAKKDTDFSERCITDNLMRFIRGWSQLSFHAMHAHRQLTQTTEMNRLYLFPAKIGLIYHKFMSDVSKLLASNEKQYFDGHKCSYFLTPQVCPKAHFISVFLPDNSDKHLILGEIPAEDLFQPRLIMPVLVHEAAHYSGSYPRDRKYRNEMIRIAAAEFIVCSLLKEAAWLRIKDKKLLQNVIQEETEWLRNLMPSEQEAMTELQIDEKEAQYSRNAKQIVMYQIHKIFSGKFGVSSLARNVAESVSQRVNGKSESLLHVARAEIDVQDNDALYKLIFTPTKDSVYNYVEQLFAIFREAFSDLCMVVLLKMKLEEYLDVIVHATDISNDDIDKHGSACRLVRYAVVIETMQKDGCTEWRWTRGSKHWYMKTAIDNALKHSLFMFATQALVSYLARAKTRLLQLDADRAHSNDECAENFQNESLMHERQNMLERLREMYSDLAAKKHYESVAKENEVVLTHLLEHCVYSQNAVLSETNEQQPK